MKKLCHIMRLLFIICITISLSACADMTETFLYLTHRDVDGPQDLSLISVEVVSPEQPAGKSGLAWMDHYGKLEKWWGHEKLLRINFSSDIDLFKYFNEGRYDWARTTAYFCSQNEKTDAKYVVTLLGPIWHDKRVGDSEIPSQLAPKERPIIYRTYVTLKNFKGSSEDDQHKAPNYDLEQQSEDICLYVETGSYTKASPTNTIRIPKEAIAEALKRGGE